MQGLFRPQNRPRGAQALSDLSAKTPKTEKHCLIILVEPLAPVPGLKPANPLS